MTKKEAIQAMLDGKKVRNTHAMYTGSNYLYFSKGNLFLTNNDQVFSINLTPDDGWKEYEEPNE